MKETGKAWKVIYGLIVVAMIVIYGATGKMVHWMFFDNTIPIEFKNAYSDEPVYDRSDLITIHYDYKKNRECPVEVVRTLTNDAGATIIIGSSPGIMSIDDTKHATSFPFPPAMRNGVWTYMAVGSYRCNPFHVLKVKTPPVTFMVVGDDT